MPRRSILALLALAFAVALGWLPAPSPSPRSPAAPPSEFSSGRALVQLARMAALPHPTGTAMDDAVRSVLVGELRATGLAVEVQDTTALTDAYARKWGLPVVAGRVRNVVARLAGTAGGPSLLLMAHYDSRELAPGASDDGFGVAALLETARALSVGPRLRHDVVVVLTEGEEQGLLGARAFFAESPAARGAGLVLNFEARGDRGPVAMFQTSDRAAPLVDTLARAAPDVVASSLSQEAYRRMPNDTDLTVALQAGLPGMNFANIDGLARYHQTTDTLANASEATLQHHGDYALALARAFGDAEPMVPASGGDAVYFNVGPLFIHYSPTVARTSVLAALAALAGALGWAMRRGRVRPGAVGLGAAVGLAALLAATAVGLGAGWVAMRASGGVLGMEELRAPVQGLYAAAIGLLGAATTWGALALGANRVSAAGRSGGAALLLVGLAVVATTLAPAASYFLAWPATAMALAWAVSPAPERPWRLPIDAAAAAVAMVFFIPLGRQLLVAFGPPVAPGLAMLAGLAVLGTAPLLEALGPARRWIGPAAAVAASAGCLAGATLLPAFDASSPRPDSLVYAVDADRDAAWWLSTDDAPDNWTATALADARRETAPEIFPRSTRQLLRAPAPRVDLPRSSVELLGETPEGTGRAMHLRVRAPQGTEVVRIAAPPEARVRSARVQARAFSPDAGEGWLDLAFTGPPEEGLDLDLVTTAAGPVSLRVVAQLRGLPASVAAPLGPRPADRMPAVGGNVLRSSDMTLVSASFTL